MNNDPLWVSFPRWINHSGLPRQMVERYSPEVWLVFRTLIELDCNANLTPDRFTYCFETVSQITGIPCERVPTILETLQTDKWIELNRLDETQGVCRIVTPIPVPKSVAEIRQGLANEGIEAGKYILRYKDDLVALNQVEKVVYFYQMLFGLRFTPRIAQDLEEIANTYDMSVIYQIFTEAHHKKVKSLSWIKSHLQKTLVSATDESS